MRDAVQTMRGMRHVRIGGDAVFTPASSTSPGVLGVGRGARLGVTAVRFAAHRWVPTSPPRNTDGAITITTVPLALLPIAPIVTSCRPAQRRRPRGPDAAGGDRWDEPAVSA